jgi:HK97 family phage major capsid protein
MPSIEQEIKALGDDVKGLITKQDEKVNELKESADNALKTEIGKINEAIATKTDELTAKFEERLTEVETNAAEKARSGGGGVREDIGAQIKAALTEGEMTSTTKGKVEFETKAITNLTGSAGPLLTPQYVDNLMVPGREQLRVRQLLGGGNTDSTMIIYFREKARTGGAGYQVAQLDTKPEADFEYEQVEAVVRDIAVWTYIARQMIDDVPYLKGVVEGELRFMIDYKEEYEILNGTGTNAMTGLNTARTEFDTTLMDGVQAPQMADVLRKAMVQVARTFFPPTGHVLNTEEWANIELLKTTDNKYLFAAPQGTVGERMWGLPVISTYAQPEGEFLTASFIAAADYWQRQATRVELSTEDGDNFRKNRATLLVEKRGTTAIKRAACLVGGEFAAALA